MNTKLNGKANTSHNHSASQITSGTLPVTRGGTGVTSLDALKTALGVVSTAHVIGSTILTFGSVGGSSQASGYINTCSYIHITEVETTDWVNGNKNIISVDTICYNPGSTQIHSLTINLNANKVLISTYSMYRSVSMAVELWSY